MYTRVLSPPPPPNRPTDPHTHTTHHYKPTDKSQGLLEKHKDYVLRARDFQRKQGTLKQLRHKAAMRNPDEFYFAMQGSKTKGGWVVGWWWWWVKVDRRSLNVVNP